MNNDKVVQIPKHRPGICLKLKCTEKENISPIHCDEYTPRDEHTWSESKVVSKISVQRYNS